MKSEKNLYTHQYDKMLQLFLKHAEDDYPAIREIKARLEMGQWTPTMTIGEMSKVCPIIPGAPLCMTCTGRGFVRRKKCAACMGCGSQQAAVNSMVLESLRITLAKIGYRLEEGDRYLVAVADKGKNNGSD